MNRIVLPPMVGFGYVKIVKSGDALLPQVVREPEPESIPDAKARRSIATPPEKEQT